MHCLHHGNPGGINSGPVTPALAPITHTDIWRLGGSLLSHWWLKLMEVLSNSQDGAILDQTKQSKLKLFWYLKDFRIAHWHCMPPHSSSRTTRSDENFQKLLCLIYCSNNSDIAENAGLLSAPVRGYWPLIGWERSRDLEPGLWLVSTRAWSKEEARSAGLFSPGEFSDNQLASLFSFCLFIKL